MKTISIYIVAFFLSLNVVIAATPPTPALYNFENPSVNQLTFNNAQIATTTPVFRVGTPAGATNPNLIYIEINTTAAFTGTDWTQTFSGSYVNGTANDFTFTNSFTPTNGVTYYVRAKASGDGGSTYSSYSSGTFSFTYQSSGNPDWYQTTQAQFLTDSLVGTTATASAGVQVSATSAGNAFTNGSFESYTSGGSCECNEPTSWTYDAYSGYLGDEASNGWVSTSTSADGVSAGSNCLSLLILDGFSGNWYADDYAEASQEVNLTGVSSVTFTNGYYDDPLDQFYDISAGSVTLYMLIDPTNSTSNVLAGNIVYSWSQPVNGSASHTPFAVTVNLSGMGYTGNNTVRFVNYVPSTFIWGDGAYMYVDDVQTVSGTSSGTITSTPVDLGSVKGGSNWANVQWNQTLNGGSISLAVQKCISGTWTNEITGITSATSGTNSNSISTIPVTTSYDSIRVVGTLIDSGGTSPSLNSWAITETVPSCTTPATPIVSASNNCGNSLLSTTATGGSLLWSTGATTSSITVTNSNTYSVTITVTGGCSATGSGSGSPLSVPSAPTVSVANNCGNSVLSTTATGTLSWSPGGAATSSITVTTSGTYSVTQTVGGCTSAAGTNTAAPLRVPSAPSISVTNYCGSSVLSTTATGTLLWSPGQAITSSIQVTTAGTYSVTQTVGGCSSPAGTDTAAPLTVPSAPIVSVINNCGSSVLSSIATGALFWSPGQAVTSSIIVNNPGTYSVTQTVGGCTSPAGTGIAAPKAFPAAPTVSVSNNCGNSVLSTTATGALLWNTGATTSSITITTVAIYSVSQTIEGCTSDARTVTPAPIAIPSAPTVSVLNNCGNSVLSTTATGALSWNTGATASSITVTTAGTYSVTQTINTCTSSAGTGLAAPSSLAAPVVTVVNNCGNSVLSTTATGTLSWSTGATSSSITVTAAGTYTVTETVGACTSTGTGTAAPASLATPIVSTANNCGYSVLSTTATGGVLLWSTGATTSSITVTNSNIYSVTITAVAGCSATGSASGSPLTIPSAPTVSVTNNCGNSLLSTTATGTLLWSTGAITSSITVTATGTYSVTQTVNTCASLAGTGTSAPKPIPAKPTVSVTNNCGNSVLSTTATGALLWNTGATTSSITVTMVEIYSVTQTAGGCTSDAGTGVAQPTSLASPIVSTANYCGYAVLSTPANGGTLLWSTGATTTSITVTNGNTYSVTITESAGCSATGTGSGAPYVIPPAPAVTVTNNCGYSALSISTTGIAGSIILWSTGATTSSITVTTAGTYSVTYTLEVCTSAVGTGTAAPSSLAAPVVTVVNNCGNSILSTIATGALSWSTGATTSSITVTTAGTYSVTETVGACTSTGTGIAAPSSLAAPVVTVVNNCGNSVLSTTATGTLSWNTGATTSSITVTTAGTYSVTETVGACTSTGIGTAAPSSLAAPAVTIVNNCGNSVLSTTAAGTLSWSTGATASSITVITAGTYTVTETVGECTNAGTGTAAPIIIPAAPTVSVVNNCGNSVLSTTATGTLLWNTGATTSSITVSTIAVYSVTQTTEGCTSDVGTGIAEPTSLPPPIVSTANYCGYAVLSTPANGGTLLWSTGATTTSITVTDLNTYSVTITQSAGCSATGAGSGAPYVIPPAPAVTVINNCGYSTLSISTTDIAGSIILWSTGATTSSITVTTAGTYSVTYTLEVCTSEVGTGTAAPSSLTAPIVTVVNNCGNSVLSTTATGTLSWSTGATTSSITVTTAGTYSVTQTDGACTSPAGTGTAAPSSLAAPTVSVVNNCGYAVLSTMATGGTLLWSTGATTTSISVTTAGTYSVTISNGSGCSATNSILVTISGQGADCSISGNTFICGSGCGDKSKESTQLCAPSVEGNSYLWSTGETTACIIVHEGGAYSVTVTTSGGCSGTCSAHVTVSRVPSCSIYTGCFGNRMCDGHGTSLCGPSDCDWNTTFLWSTGETTRCIDVTTSGTYSLTVTNANGCSSTCDRTITVGTSPSCTITGQTNICQGECSSLCGPDGEDLTYSWSTGENTQCITVHHSGTYYLTVINKSGCSSTCSVCVTVYDAPSSCISGNLYIRNGQCTTLCASGGCNSDSYLWSTGETTQCITVRREGKYCVTVTNAGGCSSSTCVEVRNQNNGCGRLSNSPDSSSISANGSMDINTYPNPFSDVATILITSATDYNNVSVELYNLNGQKIREIYYGPVKANESTQMEINGSDMENGVYIYRVSAGEDSYYGRIVLQKN